MSILYILLIVLESSQINILLLLLLLLIYFIYIQILDVLTFFRAKGKLIFFLHPSLSTHSKSPIPRSLIPVVTSCIQELQGQPFFRLPGGHHCKILLGSFY